MAKLTAQAKFVNPPRPGGTWGSVVDQHDMRHMYDLSDPATAIAMAGVEANKVYDFTLEVQQWKDKRGGGMKPVSVIKGVKPAGTPEDYQGASIDDPDDDLPPFDTDDGPVTNGATKRGEEKAAPAGAPTPPVYSRNPARVGMLFNTVRDLGIAGLDMSNEDIVTLYRRALEIDKMLDEIDE